VPDVFDIRMRLLQSVPGSVLWLLEGSPAASANLRQEAQKRGVAPERLVFAPRAPLAIHFARLKAADLFLDTFPYNAHTTATDALWVGLPIVTRMGEAFPSRVAASLSTAAGVPDLITRDAYSYEALALALARAPERLAQVRAKLEAHRDTCALFNIARYTQNLEKAYQQMWQRYEEGLPPLGFQMGEKRIG